MIPLINYDWIIVNSSSGKDSQAMLHYVVECCKKQEVPLHRVVVGHADLGRMEWEGSKELAAEQARHYGLRFEVRKNRQRDLLQAVRERGMWPSSTCRYCTSDFKRSQMRRLFTQLVEEDCGSKYNPTRILNCMGLRADESPKRQKMEPFAFNQGASNTKRRVYDWLPIHSWT